MNDDLIFVIGSRLEDEGLSHAEIDDYFLEHYGVKGMKWGVRRTRRIQKSIDRTKRIADGTASVKDRVLGSAITKKGAQRQLQRGANNQAKMLAGKRKTSSLMAKAYGIKVQDLDYGVKGDANAKLDSGQKAAIALIGAGIAMNTLRR